MIWKRLGIGGCYTSGTWRIAFYETNKCWFIERDLGETYDTIGSTKTLTEAKAKVAVLVASATPTLSEIDRMKVNRVEAAKRLTSAENLLKAIDTRIRELITADLAWCQEQGVIDQVVMDKDLEATKAIAEVVAEANADRTLTESEKVKYDSLVKQVEGVDYL